MHSSEGDGNEFDTTFKCRLFDYVNKVRDASTDVSELPSKQPLNKISISSTPTVKSVIQKIEERISPNGVSKTNKPVDTNSKSFKDTNLNMIGSGTRAFMLASKRSNQVKLETDDRNQSSVTIFNHTTTYQEKNINSLMREHSSISSTLTSTSLDLKNEHVNNSIKSPTQNSSLRKPIHRMKFGV